MPDVIVKDGREHDTKFKDINRVVVDDEQNLTLYRNGEQKISVVPVDILWGLVKFERTIDETKEAPVARFAKGYWSVYWVDGVRVNA
jgi:hypothetical protein